MQTELSKSKKQGMRLDLTSGPILKQLIRLSIPIVLSMLMFTLFIMVDLYFVGLLGPDAVAAISISGNVFFVILGLAFILGTGGMALIAQAFGRRDSEGAAKVFKQSIMLSVYVGIAAAIIGLIFADPYIRFFGGKGKALKWGVEYFQVYSISFFFVLILHVIGSCYRGMGDAKTPMIIIIQSVLLNIMLDPLLIFGLLGLPRLEVRGAAIASLISQLYAIGIYVHLIFIKQQHLTLGGVWKIQPGIIRKSLAIGLPSGLTHFFLTLNMLITYRVVSVYGTEALASIGIGFRILQAIYLPSVAIASAMGAAVGQNYGAKNSERISKTLRAGWAFSVLIMGMGTLLCFVLPGPLIGIFSDDPRVVHYGIIYLTIMSLGNIAVGTIMTVSAVFQGLGKTYPTLLAAILDNGLFALLVFTLPGYFGWDIHAIWWIKLMTAVLEMAFDAAWLKWDLDRIRKVFFFS